MNRRRLLTVGGAAVAGSMMSAPIVHAASAEISLELPPLPYPPEALEPHIDAMTMTIHHDKHHASYVTKLTEALQAAKVKSTNAVEIIQSISSLPEDQQTAIRNNGGGHVNHTCFWKWMAPAGSGAAAPEGKLGEAIQTTFSSIDEFKKLFADAAAKRFGSGWVWLVVQSGGKLAVVSTPNQDNPLMKGVVPEKDQGTPILGLDVWEHAYYLKYQNKRPDYVTAWWNVVNWAEVAKGFEAAAKG